MRSATRLAVPAIGLLATVPMIVALLWALSPWLALPLVRWATEDTGLSISEIEIERPALDGIRIPRLTAQLASPQARVRAEDLVVGWCLRCSDAGARGLIDGHLTAVSAARIALSLDEQASAPKAAGVHPPALVSLLPGALRARLPVDHLHVERIDLEVRDARGALAGNGTVDITPESMAIQGSLESVALQRPVHLRLHATRANVLTLSLTDPDGRLLIDLNADLEATGERLSLRGRVAFDTATLGPMLGLELPPVVGDLRGALDIDPDELRITLAPGTAVGANLELPQGILGVAIRPRDSFVLTLAEDRLSSDGALPLDFALVGDVSVDGHLLMDTLTGRGDGIAASLNGAGTARWGALAGAWTLATRVGSQGAGRMDLGATRLQVDDLKLAAHTRLDRLLLESAGPLNFDAQGPEFGAAPIALSAGRLEHDGRSMDLVGRRLTLKPALRGGRLESDFRLDGSGLEALGSLAYDLARDTGLLRLRSASASLAAGQIVAGALAPLVASATGSKWPIRRGHIGLSGRLSWPPEPLAGVDLVITLEDASIDIALPNDGARVNLDGIDLATTLSGGRSRLDVADLDLAMATAEYRAAPRDEPARAAGITLDAALAVSGEDLFAATADLDEVAVEVDAMDLRISRGVVSGYGIDRLHAAGSGHWQTKGLSVNARLEAATANTGIALAEIACDLALEGDRLALSACGASALGGRVTTPSASVDLATLDAYVPIAMLGLDLGATLALMQDAALDGTGTLDGAVPLRLRQGTASIADGYLGARAPGGTLRYAADDALRERLGQPGLALALTALQDFRFARLGSTVDYSEDGTLSLGVALAGASPQVEGGRAINFNLNVTQNLPLLLQSLRLSQNISDTVERRLQERFAPR